MLSIIGDIVRLFVGLGMVVLSCTHELEGVHTRPAENILMFGVGLLLMRLSEPRS